MTEKPHPGPSWRRENYAPREGFQRRGGPHAFPPAAAVLAGVIQVWSARDAARHGLVFRPMDQLSYALLLAGPFVLIWRRKAPEVVFTLAAAASIGFASFAAPRWMYAVAPAMALFSLTRHGRRWFPVIGAAVAYTAYLLITVVLAGPLGLDPGTRPDVGDAVVLAIWLFVLMLLGGAAKIRSEQMAEVMKVRAEQARAREEQEKRQASEERLRIARELHDVLGHHLSLINVQAGVGLHLMDNRPEQAREALSAIKTASSEALREVRAVLGVLRTEDEAAPRQPAVGINRLADLTADAGLPVTTTVTGEPRELPPEVDRAAYRIVQEALTNVRKHAAGPEASATIAVDYLPTALHLAIRNRHGPDEGEPEPAAAEQTPEGNGIAGMRERAQSLGGSLEAGPVDGGYLVSVLIPAEPSERAARPSGSTEKEQS
ncbi:histidine kinase [Actinoplanes sp. NPDC051411]|uniref:histidine kinase n=1 Tax=Actinoplanes sp. NPDC051411 TaxID=3155522 RepID=UPI00342DCF0F